MVLGVCPTPREARRALDGGKVELLFGGEFGRRGEEATLGTDLMRWDVGDDGVGGLDMTRRCIHEVSESVVCLSSGHSGIRGLDR